MNNKWTMNHYMNRFRALANLTNCYELTYVWLWLWYGEAYPFLYEAIEAGRYTYLSPVSSHCYTGGVEQEKFTRNYSDSNWKSASNKI